MVRPFICLLFLFVFLASSCIANTGPEKSLEILATHQEDGLMVEEIYNGEDVVWGFDFLNQHEILFSYRGGKLFHLNISNNKKTQMKGLPEIIARGQGGLLDVLIHRDDNDGIWIYITYSDNGEQSGTTVSLARAKWNSGQELSFERIFKANAYARPGRHYGSRVVIQDQYLYMSIGDRGVRDEAQNSLTHNGSIIRLHLDGSIPSTNPFYSNSEYLSEIYTYGHRNPQGLSFHPQTRELWSCEFGPKGGDEINLIRAARNYGWPKMTYGREYSGAYIAPGHVEGMEPSIIHFTPAISPSGMTFYTGDKIDGWQGHLILAALGSRHIHRVILREGKNEVKKTKRYLEQYNQRIRHVRQGEDGYLYFSTDSGKIARLSSLPSS